MTTALGALVLLLLLVIAFSPVVLLVVAVRKRESPLGKAALAIGLGFSTLWAAAVWQVYWPGSVILAEGRSPEGRDYCLVQRYQWPTEPYRVSLYVRDPAGIWWDHTVDPDASSWRGATVESGGDGRLAACNATRCHEVEVPARTVDLDGLLPGYRQQYAPAQYTCRDVFERHRR